MAEKKGSDCQCLFCNHPIVKMLAEFYFIVWGVIGLLFVIGMIWGLLRFQTFMGKDCGFQMLEQKQEMMERYR